MRVAGGSWRGREVLMPKSEAVRPTQSRVREAVFDLLRQVVPGGRFLDLFAGSGAMGIEALSRGAQEAIFWEFDRQVFATLQKNLAAFGIDVACAVRQDTFAALGLAADETAPEARGRQAAGGVRALAPFTVVFADPPYRWAQAHGLAGLGAALLARGFVTTGGFLVAEMAAKYTRPEEIPGWNLVRDRVYGTARIAVWQAQ